MITAHPGRTNDEFMADPRISVTSAGDVVVRWPTETHLVDEMLDSYIRWRDSTTAVADAYRRWSDAPREEMHRWYLGYTASLDQEQAAARRYELAITQVERWLQRGRCDR
jgi:hypothetical protein